MHSCSGNRHARHFIQALASRLARQNHGSYALLLTAERQPDKNREIECLMFTTKYLSCSLPCPILDRYILQGNNDEVLDFAVVPDACISKG